MVNYIGTFRSPRPLSPLLVRRDGHFGSLEVLEGDGLPRSFVLCDIVPENPKVASVEIGWAKTNLRLFSDRLLMTEGTNRLGKSAVFATALMDDVDPDEPFEARIGPSAGLELDWKVYVLPDMGRKAMLHEHLRLAGSWLIDAVKLQPNRAAWLYGEDLLPHLPKVADLPR